MLRSGNKGLTWSRRKIDVFINYNAAYTTMDNEYRYSYQNVSLELKGVLAEKAALVNEKAAFVREIHYLKKRCANAEEEKNQFLEEIRYLTKKCAKSEDERNESLKVKAVLEAKCAKLEEERNYYIHQGPYYELFDKYVGLYNEDEKTLIVHHFVDNESIYPYGCGDFDGDYECHSVKGSWDSWNKEYKLKKRCVRDSDGIYEGYVYYITAGNITPGDEYEFKFKGADGDWIEPIYEGQTPDDAGCQLKVRQNNTGSWNALITIK